MSKKDWSRGPQNGRSPSPPFRAGSLPPSPSSLEPCWGVAMIKVRQWDWLLRKLRGQHHWAWKGLQRCLLQAAADHTWGSFPWEALSSEDSPGLVRNYHSLPFFFFLTVPSSEDSHLALASLAPSIPTPVRCTGPTVNPLRGHSEVSTPPSPGPQPNIPTRS